MSLHIPLDYGLAAVHVSAPFGTPDFVTTIGVSLADTGTTVDMANHVMTAYKTAWQDLMLNQYTVDHVSLYVGNGDDPSGSVDSTVDPFNGVRSGAGEAVAMAPIVRKQTPVLGRQGRGRMFIPGVLLTSEVSATGYLGDTPREAIDDAAQSFYDELTNDDTVGTALNPYLFHTSATVAPTLITGFQTAGRVGWIRKRLY